MTQKRTRVWYAGSDGIARMGPFDTDVEAWQHLELAGERRPIATSRRVHVKGAYVWPEWSS